MPSQTIAGALINLWMLDLPWNFPRWQEITDIRQGLFPEDDRFLPKIGKAVVWTRHDSQDVLSFFEQYKNLSTDAERTKFITQSRGAVLPGRNIWVKFVAKGWPRWNVHGQIINQLNLHDIHPLKLMLSENTVTEWPAATLFLPEALDDIGVDLFGPEALSPTSGRLPIAIRECIRMLSQQTWLHIRKQVERSRNKIEVLERDALELVSDINQSTPTKAEVRKAIRAVGKWRNMAEVLCTEDNLSKIDSITLDLNITLKSLGILRNTGTKGKGKQDRKSLLLATEDDILDLQRLYSEYFDTQMECDPVLETAIPFGAYLSNEGSPTDLGLELEAHMSPDSISAGSKDWMETPVLDLRPFIPFLGVHHTTDREMDIILGLAEAAKENVALEAWRNRKSTWSLPHIVIRFLDQLWSAQDEHQIRGRARRQPQEGADICYHIRVLVKGSGISTYTS